MNRFIDSLMRFVVLSITFWLPFSTKCGELEDMKNSLGRRSSDSMMRFMALDLTGWLPISGGGGGGFIFFFECGELERT